MANVSVLLFDSRNLEEKQTTIIDETGRGSVASTHEKDSSKIIRIIIVVITLSCRFLEEKYFFDAQILESLETPMWIPKEPSSYVQLSMQLCTWCSSAKRENLCRIILLFTSLESHLYHSFVLLHSNTKTLAHQILRKFNSNTTLEHRYPQR